VHDDTARPAEGAPLSKRSGIASGCYIGYLVVASVGWRDTLSMNGAHLAWTMGEIGEHERAMLVIA
jgi:hypothetical protein